MKITIKQICPRCGKEFEIEIEESLFQKGKYRKFCSRSCANARVHSEETKRKTSASVKKYYDTHPNALPFFTTHKTNKTHKVYTCKYCGKEFTMKDYRDTTGRKYCSQNCKDTWLRENLYSKSGGYRENSGRGKSGWYKGIYCSSTWELAFVVYHLDNGLKIERCNEKRKYIYEGVEHTYYPDFITDEGIIEIKGYNTNQWQAKHDCNPDIKVLFEKDMKSYINYVRQKYTPNLTELYDNSKPIDTNPNRKYYWVHKGNNQTMITPNKLEEYLSNGWIKGRLSKFMK